MPEVKLPLPPPNEDAEPGEPPPKLKPDKDTVLFPSPVWLASRSTGKNPKPAPLSELVLMLTVQDSLFVPGVQVKESALAVGSIRSRRNNPTTSTARHRTFIVLLPETTLTPLGHLHPMFQFGMP